MTKKAPKKVDYILLAFTVALFIVGLVMLWSASTAESEKNFGNTSYYVIHQLLYGGIAGLILMYICSRIDYHFWQKVVPIVLIGSLIALILVKVPGLGFAAGGATRWVHFGPIVFQPAEIAKLAIIIYVASWMSKRGKDTSFLGSVFPPLVIIALFALLIMWQPDLGTTVSLVLTALLMFFVGGIHLRYFFGITGVGFLALLVLIKLEPYRVRRITAFLNRSVDPQGIGYQINQALLAIGTGGWFGYGYGHSRQKYFYLPEAINDSIFAVMAEELGFVRVTAILILFAGLIFRGLRVSLRAPDTFGKMLALGIVGGLAINTVINLGAILGLLPLTGIPLPFFSYGSSALIVTLASMGILLNISRHTTA
jgi:cell division protein FtsW